MAFDVLITDEAFADLDAIADFIRQQSNLEAGRKWFDAMVITIQTLREMPARCPRASEAEEICEDVRLLLHGRKSRAYKIYFKIAESISGSGSVYVLHIRHWARKPLTNQELEEMADDRQYADDDES